MSRSPGVRKVARGGRAKLLREESSEEDGDSDRWVCVCVCVCMCVLIDFVYILCCWFRKDVIVYALCTLYVFLLFSLPFVQ